MGFTISPWLHIPATQTKDQVNPLVTALADVLGISLQGGSTPGQQLLELLSRKEMLLIYDNFEHLLDQALFLSDLLIHAPDIKILTTSRERLNLQQEWLFPLQGLLYPTEGEATHQHQNSSALQLFQQRALQLKPSFNLEVELPAILRICQLVNGMPLALELAASWVRHLDCATIAEEIQSEIDFLTSRAQNVPARHRSIRALFSYSWQHLTPEERLGLQRMSVFSGSFERNAARHVSSASLPLLQSLVDKSLLTVTENAVPDSHNQPRFRIHELLRQFAAEKLAESAADETDCSNAHCHYFLNLVAVQDPILKGPDGLQAMATIEADIENIRLAIRWGVAHQPQLFDQPFGTALQLFLTGKGWNLEGEATFTRIAATLKAQCHMESADASPNSLAPICILWAQYHCNVGVFQHDLGQVSTSGRDPQRSTQRFFDR